jgi:hypothetical protein
LRGQCEEDINGDYTSLEECQSQCQGSDNVDLTYLILSYDWGTASRATITDQQELLKREFGVHVSRDETIRIVSSLAKHDIRALLKESQVFVDYVNATITPFDTFLLLVSEILPADYPLDWVDYDEGARYEIGKVLNGARLSVDHLISRLESRLIYNVLTEVRWDVMMRFNLEDLITVWLPELFRVLAPEQYEELYQ